MDLRRITDDFSVSPQIECEDVADIAAAGFRSILCNRPDDEELGQCAYDDVAKAAADAGLAVRSVPIISGRVTPEDAQAFRAALEEMPKPILAYCRSGTRCTMLWSIASFGALDPDQIVSAAADAGYDVSGLVRQLQQKG
ncbi:Beta-lactamase hydrolase-like protein [Roseovarius litorisediminis]|uniref:Beta-lactamase hydrolase-like protein n=1 Tax=Roseovarius litorisediminis TaxID=1312363 RepID=A0A1Y5RPS6_9RHOB|nr:TIGR01244 family sulfur transferase [Roseovarius litorisediminis]SLN19789.1 Beta-lactamase hydrolase-like protein [Roseovarius litorisediminis]